MDNKDLLWTPIRGYEGYYEVTATGKVRSIDQVILTRTGRRRALKGKVLQFKDNSYGYKFVMLCKSGTKQCFYIHRLVADTFLSNPLKKSEVNHINGNKSDNRAFNLEWVTPSENARYAHRNKLSYDISKSEKFTYVYDTRRKRFYMTIRAAADEFGINYSTLRAMLKGSRKNTTTLEYMKCSTIYSDRLEGLPDTGCRSIAVKVIPPQYEARHCHALAR